MVRYVAFLKGINVGRNHRMKIYDIVSFLSGLFGNVTSYGQSGNFVFDSEMEKDDVVSTIESGFEKEFGSNAFCIVKTIDELRDAVSNNPFPDAGGDELYFTFMNDDIPNDEDDEWSYKEDRAKRIGNVVYLNCKDKYHETVLSNKFFEKELDAVCTTRNLNTVTAILKL